MVRQSVRVVATLSSTHLLPLIHLLSDCHWGRGTLLRRVRHAVGDLEAADAMLILS